MSQSTSSNFPGILGFRSQRSSLLFHMNFKGCGILSTGRDGVNLEHQKQRRSLTATHLPPVLPDLQSSLASSPWPLVLPGLQSSLASSSWPPVLTATPLSHTQVCCGFVFPPSIAGLQGSLCGFRLSEPTRLGFAPHLTPWKLYKGPEPIGGFVKAPEAIRLKVSRSASSNTRRKSSLVLLPALWILRWLRAAARPTVAHPHPQRSLWRLH